MQCLKHVKHQVFLHSGQHMSVKQLETSWNAGNTNISKKLKKTKHHYLNFNNIQFLLQNIESNNIFKTKITEFVNQPFQSNFINLFTQL